MGLQAQLATLLRKDLRTLTKQHTSGYNREGSEPRGDSKFLEGRALPLCPPRKGPLHFLINLLFGTIKQTLRLAGLLFLSGLRLNDQVDNSGDFIDFRWGYFNILLRWLNRPLMSCISIRISAFHPGEE